LRECTDVHTIGGYEWSRSKATANLWKHGVDFAEATTVLADDLAITVEDEGSQERRWVTIGPAPRARSWSSFTPGADRRSG
jgi:uncharacterized DUF497 family protein